MRARGLGTLCDRRLLNEMLVGGCIKNKRCRESVRTSLCDNSMVLLKRRLTYRHVCPRPTPTPKTHHLCWRTSNFDWSRLFAVGTYRAPIGPFSLLLVLDTLVWYGPYLTCIHTSTPASLCWTIHGPRRMHFAIGSLLRSEGLMQDLRPLSRRDRRVENF